jgi:hypothetical protein
MKENTNMPHRVGRDIEILVSQLGLDFNFLLHEIKWALGEERINRVTPKIEQFLTWSRQPTGLYEFWKFANEQLGLPIDEDEIHDIWNCISLTLSAHRRRSFSFQDYLMIAIRSEQKCAFCSRSPPEVTLEIDHVLPVSKGGRDLPFNLRFLCQHCNRSRGNCFRWADVWRNSI